MVFKVFIIYSVGLLLLSESSGVPQAILVNDVWQNDTVVNYTFNDGELVNVTCGFQEKRQDYKLKMDYNFSRNYDVPDQLYQDYSQYKSNDPVGFQLRMRAGNDQTYAICTSQQLYKEPSERAVQINFHMNYDDPPVTTKSIAVKPKPSSLYESSPACSMQIGVNQHHRLQNNTVNPSLQLYESTNRYYLYEYKEDANFYMTCTACCNINVVVKMQFNNSGHILQTSEDLNITRNIDKSAILKNKVFKCGLISSSDLIMSRSLVFIPYVAPTTTTSTSTSATTTTIGTIESSVSELPSDASYSGSNKNDEMGDEGTPWKMPVVGSVTCVVIFCVSTVIYKIKYFKNKKCNPQWQPGDVNYENLPNDSSPIPPYPTQWETNDYADPADRAEEPTYCEPFTGPRGNVKNELYTMPVPKSRRKPANNQTPEPTYEDLDANQPSIIQHETDDPNYAEITPSAFKNKLNLMYAQVLPKTQRQNLNKSESVNVINETPNYAQVVPKNMRKCVDVEDGNPNYAQVVPKNMRKCADVEDDNPNYAQVSKNMREYVNVKDDNPNYAQVSKNMREYVNAIDDKPNYAQVVPKSMRGKEQEGAGTSKYVNVHDGSYVNANADSDYAEPAYCQPSYLKNKK